MSTDSSRYTRRHRIATGGMGQVWLAHDEVLHRDVAVKYLRREFADDEGARTRFLHEARNAAALLHPGIATVFDFGESEVEDGLPFIVMEYVEGRTLSAILADEAPLDPERARDLMVQAAQALSVAHAIGLVHRDVKPGNLMVTADGTVKITDFGIARVGDGLALTETGQLIGTPSYLSPEQAEGRVATPASDVYALGVVLFECLAGRRPFVADAPVAIALAHVREPVPDLPPEVPEDLVAVTRRAMAKHPDDRYPDAGAFAAALAALTPDPTMVLTAPVAAAPVVGGPDDHGDGGLGARLGDRIRIPRERWPLALAAVMVVLFLVIVGVAALSPDGNGTKDTPAPSAPSSPTASTKPTTVRVDPAAYVGKPVSTVKAALVALGLKTRSVTVSNPGGHTAGTVSALRPTGAVRLGATVTMDVWGAAPAPKTTTTTKSGGGKSKSGKGKGKGH